MNATFDLQSLFPDESFDFLGVKIPKYGSLTPNEQKALIAIDENLSMLFYKCAAVRILLVSRCNIAEDTDIGKLPIHVIDEAYDFVVGEIHEWKPKQQEDTEKKESTGLDSTTSLDSTTLTPNSGTVQSTSSESP